MSSCLTWRQQRGPRASPGTGRGDGAHQEPLVKVGSAPGAQQGRGEPGRRRAGVGSWRGWGRASQLCSRRWPLRLETLRERTQGGVNLGCTGRDSARCGWVVGPCCVPGGRQCGWEPAGSPAGPGRNLASRGGVGHRGSNRCCRACSLDKPPSCPKYPQNERACNQATWVHLAIRYAR